MVARVSAFSFKGRDMDVRRIGRELGVRTVLEGSVRRAGDRLRVSAQLIDVADGYHLWSERYDRTLDDVFAVQDEIAGNIAETLKARLQEIRGSFRTRDSTSYEQSGKNMRAAQGRAQLRHLHRGCFCLAPAEPRRTAFAPGLGIGTDHRFTRIHLSSRSASEAESCSLTSQPVTISRDRSLSELER